MKSSSVLFIVFISFVCELCACGTPLSGIIRSDKGQPLAHVKVLTYAPLQKETKSLGLNMTTQRYEVMSDERGFFRLPDHGRVVYFTQRAQRPVTKILALSATTVQVVMEAAAATLWQVPQCKTETDKAKTGIAFKVLALNNVQAKQDVRFGLDIFYYDYQMPGGQIERMVNWQDSTSSHPREETFLEAKEFTERVWAAGERFGYDVRGERHNGKVWRYVSYRWGALSYQGSSPESAQVFDKMIDGMCFEEQDAKKYPHENF